MKHSLVKPLIAVLFLTASASALALTKDITVTANIDSSLDMTQSDNSPLPSTVAMQYFPGTGLASVTLQTKIWSNATTAGSGNIHVQLSSDPALTNTSGNNTQIPLEVTYGGKTLTTSDTEGLTVDQLFPNLGTGASTGSIVEPLVISQKTPGAQETGSYAGVVSLYLFQDATTGA
jgi:hypothetical protein